MSVFDLQHLTGKQLGQYELRQLMGRGSMGAVYRAYQPNLAREVAIKVLSPMLATERDYYERFNREAKMAAALEHPHIVAVYDYGTHDIGNDADDRINYVVMRLLTGGSLDERIDQLTLSGEATMPLTEVGTLLDQLADALDYAHSKGVIHRDVKLSNVMFDQRGAAYLVDFGIARLLQSVSTLTGDNMVGTPDYMPPEQWRGESITPAADQYALGVMIYHLLSGQPPFEAPTPYALMHKHLNEIPISLDELSKDLPPMIGAVVGRALAKSPDDRYPSVMEFAKAFERAIESKPAPASVPATAAIPVAAPEAAKPQSILASLSTARTDKPQEPASIARAANPQISASMSAKTSPPRPTEVMDKPSARQITSKWGLAVGAVIAALVLVIVVGMVLRSQNPTTVVGVLPTEMALPTLAPTSVPPTTTELEPTFTTAPIETQLVATLVPTEVALAAPPTLAVPTTALRSTAHFEAISPEALAIYTAPVAELSATLAPLRIPPGPPAGGGPPPGGPPNNNNQSGGQPGPPASNVGGSPPEIAYALMVEGIDAAEQDDLDAALGYYEQAVAADSRFVPARYMRAQAYAALGRTSEAQADYDLLISGDDGRFPYAFVGRGQLEYDNGEYEAAIADFSQTIQRDGSYEFAYYGRGLAYAQMGDYTHALSDFDQALRLDPNAAYVYDQRAHARLLAGDFEGAAADYGIAINGDPNNAALYAGRGDAFAALGDEAAALTDFQRALCIDASMSYVSQRISELGGPSQFADCAQ
jgi:eukaryotic-like serine/threonine-protein kinase